MVRVSPFFLLFYGMERGVSIIVGIVMRVHFPRAAATRSVRSLCGTRNVSKCRIELAAHGASLVQQIDRGGGGTYGGRVEIKVRETRAVCE